MLTNSRIEEHGWIERRVYQQCPPDSFAYSTRPRCNYRSIATEACCRGIEPAESSPGRILNPGDTAKGLVNPGRAEIDSACPNSCPPDDRSSALGEAGREKRRL